MQPKTVFFGTKGPGTEPSKTTKSEKVTFSHKPMILHLLVKFKQKKKQKNPRIQPKTVFFGTKMARDRAPKNDKKSHFFTQTYDFTTFRSNLSKKWQINQRLQPKTVFFGTKRAWDRAPKNHKNQKSQFFTQTHGFTTFSQI